MAANLPPLADPWLFAWSDLKIRRLLNLPWLLGGCRVVLVWSACEGLNLQGMCRDLRHRFLSPLLAVCDRHCLCQSVHLCDTLCGGQGSTTTPCSSFMQPVLAAMGILGQGLLSLLCPGSMFPPIVSQEPPQYCAGCPQVHRCTSEPWLIAVLGAHAALEVIRPFPCVKTGALAFA
jgi:hypothetical protein